MSKMIDKELAPKKIKAMSLNELELLSYEIRDFLIENIAKTGGHLASNLGVVELTIALHKVFDMPYDKLIWDVGHQAYVHKILTGRAEMFGRLRQTGGISGFPKRNESKYDFYDSGHSSSSISAAYGMAAARDLAGDEYEIVAVIGDGALTGGMAFEALNNVGASESKLIVVLNDNQMSISQNTGGITKHLSKLRTSRGYLNFKKHLKTTLKNIPNVGESIYRGAESLRDSLKYALVDGGAIFEELGFTYLGPINGNNLEETIESLAMAKRAEGPVLVHVTTVKGKGYKNAEVHPNIFHGVGPFDQSTGKPFISREKTFAQVFGEKMCDIADENDKAVAISAAMIDGTGLTKFARRFPTRMFDVGIAEEHAVAFAAGLALSGYRPVVAIYSTFLQRAYDQVMIDICMQNLPVIFAVDRAGNVGNDGETHHGMFDIAYLSSMPNMTVLAPADGAELREMLDYAMTLGGPCAIRYPRGSAGNISSGGWFTGKSRLIKPGRDCEIWAVGNMRERALAASETLEKRGYSVGVVSVSVIKPLDKDMISGIPGRAGKVVTIEDGAVCGGFGEMLAASFADGKEKPEVLNIGWPDKFVEHGNTEDLYEKYGFSAESIAERICEFIEG